MVEDPLWPRAAHWLASAHAQPAFAVLGVPAHETSISATNAHRTPSAVREALQRYSTYHLGLDCDVRDLPAQDFGDVDSPDHADGELRVIKALRAIPETALLFAIGGDNSITHSVMSSRFDLSTAGLVTLDAHFDLRDGVSNGSPVRRLIEAGLDPKHIVQIGINDFSNSSAYAARAKSLGITIVHRETVERVGIESVMQEALATASSGGGGVHVDLDIDVCDRAFVPACPAAAPGGLRPYDVRLAARIAGAHPAVRAIDATEVDATMDAPDGRTVRLVALCLLEAAAGRLASVARTSTQ